MVSAQSGNVFDSFILTKPVGWAFDATAKASFASEFIPTYQEPLGQRYGYSGASAAAKAILTVVYENPQLFTDLTNATLVQNINVMDTLASTLEVQFVHPNLLSLLLSVGFVLFYLSLFVLLSGQVDQGHYWLPGMAVAKFSAVYACVTC